MPGTPQAIAEKGEAIYKEHYQEEYEKKFPGQFVAIDIESGKAFVASTPEKAIQNARTSNPKGLLHLIKIGSPGVYRVGYASSLNANWIFGR